MSANTTRFRDWHNKQMQDPAFRAEWERTRYVYQVTRLRLLRGLTQNELAKKVGTRQSSIARLESGNGEPSLTFLRKVVEALGGRLTVEIIRDEPVADTQRVISTADEQAGADLFVYSYWPDPEKECYVVAGSAGESYD